MSVNELASYLRVARRTIYRMLEAGSIPAVRAGKQWRFRREAIDEWMLAAGRSGLPHHAHVTDMGTPVVVRMAARRGSALRSAIEK